jgi:cell division protein ZapA
MAQVTVTIAGRAYRMACGDGEEQHLDSLARLFDGKIDEMRTAFGEIGDMRLHVMAALTLADELTDVRRRLAGLEAEAAAFRESLARTTRDAEAREERLADHVGRAAERIERLAKALSTPQT